MPEVEGGRKDVVAIAKVSCCWEEALPVPVSPYLDDMVMKRKEIDGLRKARTY